MRAHCLFEQSGTFKNEFNKLGIEAYDYDILNNFGETDYVVDLFQEIENGYEGKPQVNHIDGNKRNNSITNLEWVTNKENCDKAREIRSMR